MGKSLELEPGRPYVHLQLGLAHAGNGDDEAAAQTLRQAAVLSVAEGDQRGAVRAMQTLRSMGLESQFTSDEIGALEKRIAAMAPA